MALKLSDLKKLINALNPTEKQQFKKKNGPENDFVLLFTFINKSDSPTADKAIRYIVKNRKTRKAYSSTHLAVTKQYLKDKILESLRLQYYQKRAPFELLIRSLNSDILLEKGLFELASQEINTAKQKFIGISFPIEKLLLLRKESILMFYENYRNTDLDDINRLFENRLSHAEQMILEVKFARILTILSYQYFKGIKDKSSLDQFINEDYMLDGSLSKDFATQYLFHWVHAQISEFENNQDKALFHFENAIRTWIDNPKYILSYPRMYLGACTTYLKYILQSRSQYSEILKTENFEQLLSFLNVVNLSKDEFDRFEQLILIGSLLALRKAEKFEEIIKRRNEFLGVIKTYSVGSEFLEMIVHYVIGTSYFTQESYQNAQDHISTVIHEERLNLWDNPEYLTLYIMLYLLIHFEQGNERYLSSQLPKLKKRLVRMNQLSEFEETFFRMISQLLNKRYKNQEGIVFDRFNERFQKILKTGQIENKIEYELISNWVAKKSDLAA